MGKSLVSCFFDSLCSSTCGVTIVGCIENESVPVQLAQCWFHALATSNIKIKIYFFSNRICGSNFIKQHSETVAV